jgi:hypothetical protein
MNILRNFIIHIIYKTPSGGKTVKTILWGTYLLNQCKISISHILPWKLYKKLIEKSGYSKELKTMSLH